MRSRITTLVLSGLTSAALVWGASGTAYASPVADHSAASTSTEAPGEWVDSLLRLAEGSSTSADGARTITSSGAVRPTQAVRPFHRTDVDTEPEDALVDGQEPGAALSDETAQAGEQGTEGERLTGQAPSTLPMGTNGSKDCLHEPGHEHRGHLASQGLGMHFCLPEVPSMPFEHGKHGVPGILAEHGEQGEHGKHNEHCKHDEKCEHGEHCKPCQHGKPDEHGGQEQAQNQHHGQDQNSAHHQQDQSQDVDVTVLVQNSVTNNNDNSSKSTAVNLNKIKFVAEEVEARPEHKPAHHGRHEMKPGPSGEGEKHHGKPHHGELAETGAPKTPVLLGLSAAFLAAGAAATRLSRRRVSQR
ncbi:hypothetical protein [Kitasatospora sp. NPDC017646]|uniref:hypothetical protein n=1 Tax=Kitasatospora sp. NPDC017646 TaxID=3364024 RepID=UPI0037B0FACD